MYQIDNATAATSQPASTPAGTAGFFTDGNPATNVPATIVPAEWLNSVMMELVNLVLAGGLTLQKNSFSQVTSAVKAIGRQRVILTDTGVANAYAATNTPAYVAGTWVDGVVQFVKIANANTGASTYSPDGLTPIPIYGLNLTPLQGGELRANCVATLVKATIAGVNSGNPVAVLLHCYGAPLQVATSSQSNHAVNQSQVLGVAQTMQTVTGSRAIGTTYTNTTGKPIFVYMTCIATSADAAVFGQVNGNTACVLPIYANGLGAGICFLVPAGATYAVQQTNTVSLSAWHELRT